MGAAKRYCSSCWLHLFSLNIIYTTARKYPWRGTAGRSDEGTLNYKKSSPLSDFDIFLSIFA
jgi:hypothetical protein